MSDYSKVGGQISPRLVLVDLDDGWSCASIGHDHAGERVPLCSECGRAMAETDIGLTCSCWPGKRFELRAESLPALSDAERADQKTKGGLAALQSLPKEET